MARVRAVVGDRWAYQHFPAGVFTGVWIVGVVPALEARQAILHWSGGGVLGIHRLHHTVDREEFPHLWTD